MVSMKAKLSWGECNTCSSLNGIFFQWRQMFKLRGGLDIGYYFSLTGCLDEVLVHLHRNHRVGQFPQVLLQHPRHTVNIVWSQVHLGRILHWKPKKTSINTFPITLLNTLSHTLIQQKKNWLDIIWQINSQMNWIYSTPTHIEFHFDGIYFFCFGKHSVYT